MLALIDSDILLYRCAWASQAEVEQIALSRLEESINLIKETLNTGTYQCILSPIDGSNFRYKIDPSYKANRKDQEKPIHYQALRNHLLEAHNATVAVGEEADDLLGILQCSQASEDDSIIVSIDKDLNQIPGNHFHFVKGDIYYVSPEEGNRWFYRQLLIGDTTDNITGIRGIGEKRSDTWLAGAITPLELYNIVAGLYQETYGKEQGQIRLERNAQLLWIRRKQGEVWQRPV